MGRKPDPVKQTPFPRVWEEIRSFHYVNYRSRLRIAANLIGYHLFPAGWTWGEYRIIEDDDQCAYEQSAIQNLQSIGEGVEAKGLPSKLSKNAAKFRCERVESYLRELIDRRSLRIYEGSLAEPRALKEFDKPERTLDDQDKRHFQVAESIIGARMYSKRVCEVDTRELVAHLLGSNEARGGESKHDWIVIELWFRRSIENQGVPTNASESVHELQSWYTAQHAADYPEPPTDRCKHLLASLIEEYGYTKKTGFFPL